MGGCQVWSCHIKLMWTKCPSQTMPRKDVVALQSDWNSKLARVCWWYQFFLLDVVCIFCKLNVTTGCMQKHSDMSHTTMKLYLNRTLEKITIFTGNSWTSNDSIFQANKGLLLAGFEHLTLDSSFSQKWQMALKTLRSALQAACSITTRVPTLPRMS